MVLEVVLPLNPSPSTALPDCTDDEVLLGGCALPNSYRFEVDCTAGGLLFELPSEGAFTGYYHVESAQVPAAARRMVLQNTACVREVYVAEIPQNGPVDAGTSDGPTQDESIDADTADEPARDGSMDAETTDGLTSEAGHGCRGPDVSIPTGGSCGTTVTHCTSVWTGDCWDDALAEAVNPVIRLTCGNYCGPLSLGLSGGCVTIVDGKDLASSGGGSVPCVERYLMGHRFDCVPSDGWVTLFLDTCLY